MDRKDHQILRVLDRAAQESCISEPPWRAVFTSLYAQTGSFSSLLLQGHLKTVLPLLGGITAWTFKYAIYQIGVQHLRTDLFEDPVLTLDVNSNLVDLATYCWLEV